MSHWSQLCLGQADVQQMHFLLPAQPPPHRGECCLEILPAVKKSSFFKTFLAFPCLPFTRWLGNLVSIRETNFINNLFVMERARTNHQSSHLLKSFLQCFLCFFLLFVWFFLDTEMQSVLSSVYCLIAASRYKKINPQQLCKR